MVFWRFWGVCFKSKLEKTEKHSKTQEGDPNIYMNESASTLCELDGFLLEYLDITVLHDILVEHLTRVLNTPVCETTFKDLDNLLDTYLTMPASIHTVMPTSMPSSSAF